MSRSFAVAGARRSIRCATTATPIAATRAWSSMRASRSRAATRSPLLRVRARRSTHACAPNGQRIFPRISNPQSERMPFVIHAVDRAGGMATRAKFYRAHRIHLDQAEQYEVDVVTAGTLVGEDGETPAGSI